MEVDVERPVLVDTGSSVNVLYLDVFNKLKLEVAMLTLIQTPLFGFTEDIIQPEGMIRLPVEIDTYPRILWVEMEFLEIRLECVHNAILSRPSISQIGVVIYIPNLCMKFQTLEGVRTLRGDVRSTRKCYVRAIQKQETESSRVNTILKRKDEQKREQPKPHDEIEEVLLVLGHPYQV